MSIMQQFYLSRTKALQYLGELGGAGWVSNTLYLPHSAPGDQQAAIESILGPEGIAPELSRLASASPTGAAIFWSESRQVLVLPPFPLSERYIIQGCDAAPLIDMLNRDLTIAIIMVRLGSFAVGLCRGESLIASKVGTGLVHGRHRQGGSSSARFQRRRHNQADAFLDRVCGHIRERLGLEARQIDYIVYGGARVTFEKLIKICPLLQGFDGVTLPPLLEIPAPRQPVLEAAVKHVWSCHIVRWEEDGADQI